MANLLLAALLVAILVFGYHLINYFGKIVDDSLRFAPQPRPFKGIFLTGTAGKSAGAVSREVYAVLDSLPEGDDYQIIITRQDNAPPGPESAGEHTR